MPDPMGWESLRSRQLAHGQGATRPPRYVSVCALFDPPGLGLQDRSVDIRLDASLARIYYRGELIKTHPRQEKGKQITDPADLAAGIRDYVARDHDPIRRRARGLGEAVASYADALLGTDPTWARQRSGRSLLKLGRRFGPEALEAACGKALELDLVDVKWPKRVLLAGLERQPLEEVSGKAPPGRSVRPGSVFAISGGNGHFHCDSGERRDNGNRNGAYIR